MSRKRTDTPGVYQLHLVLDRPTRIAVGKLGDFEFPAGCYVYTGSALGGLERRLSRHRSRPVRLHWHIDYLLRHARLVREDVTPTREPLECSLSRMTLRMPGAQVVVPRFGSSDCTCPSHLVYLGPVPADV